MPGLPDSPLQIAGHWQLRLLGGLEARNGDLVVTRFVTRATALLLARLALWPQRMHAREELVDLLWPEADLEAGRNRLRQSLAALKRLLEPPARDGPPVILAERLALRINPQALSCDVQDFERCLRDGRHDEARALYRGELLPGFYDDWVQDERHRLVALAERLGERQNQDPPDTPAPAPPPAARAAAPHDGTALPVSLTRLFGRGAELEQLHALVLSERLVTVCGPGGCGKTRLATELLQRLRGDPAFDLLAFVPLAECHDEAQLRSQVRISLQLPPVQRETVDPVMTALVGRRALLVLDNVEQLVCAPVLECLEQWLARLPGMHLLLTSRRVLGLPGERDQPLAPLPLPPPGADEAALLANPGVALFIDRARALRPDWRVPRDQLPALVALCRALDGLPLAIELAAARSRVFSIAEMHEALSRRFDLLQRTGPSARGRRHDSLQSTIDWSWRLLDAPRQSLLAALAVFRSGWTAGDAAAVAGAADARAMLEALLADSLITLDAPDADAPALRFQMLESIRAFVLDRTDPARQRALRAAHRAHFLALAQAAGGAALADEHGSNLAEALRTALDDGEPAGALELAWALRGHWDSAGLPPELLPRLDAAAAALPAGHALAAPVDVMLALLHLTAGAGRQARDCAARALERAGPLGAWRAMALCAAVRIGFELDRQASGLEPLLDEAGALADAANDAAARAEVTALRGMLLVRHGDDPQAADALLRRAALQFDALGLGHRARRLRFERACCMVKQRRWQEGLDEAVACEQAFVAAGDRHQRLAAINLQGVLHASQRHWADALAAYRRCASLAWTGHNHFWLAYALWNHGRNLARLHDAQRAARLMAFSERFWLAHFGPLDREDQRYVRRVRRLVERQLGQAAAAAAWRGGEALSLAQAVGLALDAEPSETPTCAV